MSPDRQPSRAPRKDAERNRTVLIAAARQLFDGRGVGVPLDEIARTAGVANATLYRHFPTRAELIVAVYADEVAELDALATTLAHAPNSGVALTQWLTAFVRHVADKRELAHSVPDGDGRDELFATWHSTMHAAADRLLVRARADGLVRADLTAAELLPVLSGAAVSVSDAERRPPDAIVELLRDGYRPRPTRNR